ncbi:hypothetical protein [Gramella sp. KN1008]|uniref:hypothetical protein n=1 Tax=Gramella sp. KN1008 TaxID=2529298 RepID=UPI001040907E|nr:hypothetical protein [Gramella sp. KN1008]TBW27087.1 hypothetical protein EZJ28_12285 [Gramella sp. KN1008]
MKSIKKLSLIVLSASLVFIYSCKDEEKSEQAEETTTTASAEEMKENMSKSSELKYNPAHGEEGHRCDLPVGAPLNQASASNTQDMNTSPVRIQSATPQLNPPHGEPGHDCSKPVGAEL